MNACVGSGTGMLVTWLMISTKWKLFQFTKHTKQVSAPFLHLAPDNQINESDWTDTSHNMNTSSKNPELLPVTW